MGEWSAVGFYEGLELPWPRSYGLAYRKMYENMDVLVSDDRLLIPSEPQAHVRTRDSHGYWSANSTILHHNHHAGLSIDWRLAADRKRECPQCAAQIDEIVHDLQTRLVHFGGYTHSNPDIRRIVNEGFVEIEHELDTTLDAARSEAGDSAATNLLLALRDYATGVRAYHRRTPVA